jgi:hypothetical protein
MKIDDLVRRIVSDDSYRIIRSGSPLSIDVKISQDFGIWVPPCGSVTAFAIAVDFETRWITVREPI